MFLKFSPHVNSPHIGKAAPNPIVYQQQSNRRMRSEIGPQWNCHTLHFVTGHRLYMLFSHLKNVSKCSLKRSKRQLLLICCLSLKLYLNCKTQHFESLIFHGRVKKHITFHSIGLQQSVLVCMKLIKLAYLVALWERL